MGKALTVSLAPISHANRGAYVDKEPDRHHRSDQAIVPTRPRHIVGDL